MKKQNLFFAANRLIMYQPKVVEDSNKPSAHPMDLDQMGSLAEQIKAARQEVEDKRTIFEKLSGAEQKSIMELISAIQSYNVYDSAKLSQRNVFLKFISKRRDLPPAFYVKAAEKLDDMTFRIGIDYVHPDALAVLANSQDEGVREHVANNKNCPKNVLTLLGKDPSAQVRYAVLNRKMERKELDADTIREIYMRARSKFTYYRQQEHHPKPYDYRLFPTPDHDAIAFGIEFDILKAIAYGEQTPTDVLHNIVQLCNEALNEGVIPWFDGAMDVELKSMRVSVQRKLKEARH